MDFQEKQLDYKREYSQEDKMFMSKTQESMIRKDGRYQLCLPFRNDYINLPDKKIQAVKRLKSLGLEMSRNKKFHFDYTSFVETILGKGYAEAVIEEELSRNDAKLWYLPHHGVYHLKKNKLLVVFRCAAKFRGVSPNDVLLQTSDLTTIQ